MLLLRGREDSLEMVLLNKTKGENVLVSKPRFKSRTPPTNENAPRGTSNTGRQGATTSKMIAYLGVLYVHAGRRHVRPRHLVVAGFLKIIEGLPRDAKARLVGDAHTVAR